MLFRIKHFNSLSEYVVLMQVLIDSQVGVDDIYSESWKIFYDSIKSQETKDALTHCSPVEGACRRPIIHDRDDSGEKTGRARIETYTLATGRPNIIEPFTKRVTFFNNRRHSIFIASSSFLH